MDHGSEAARPTTVESTGAVQRSEANIGSGTFDSDGQLGAVQRSEANIGSRTFDFDGQLRAAAAPLGSFSDFDLSAVTGRGEVPVAAAGFHLHRQPGPGVVYLNIAELWRQPGPVYVLLVAPQLPDGVVPVHDNYGYYSALQPRPGAGRGLVLVDLLPGGGGGGAVYNGDYALQPRPGAGQGEVLVDLLRHGVGHGEVFVGLIPGRVDADNYGYYALQPRPGAGHGEVLVDLLPDGAGHGQVLVGLLLGSGGIGSGEVFIGPLSDGAGAVFINSGSFAQQTLPGTGLADGMAGTLRVPNLGAGYDASAALADDLGAVYDNRGVVAEHLRRLLPFAGIGASSVAVNGLAAGPGSPAAAFHVFVLLLGGLFLVILHVLRG